MDFSFYLSSRHNSFNTINNLLFHKCKKKLDLRGASRPPSILIRRRSSNAGREIPRTLAFSDLGSGAISWNRYPGRDRYPLGRKTVTPGRARLTTQPKLSGAQRGGFFPTGGEIRPGGGSNPPPVECRRLLRTTRANNLRLWGVLLS